jgi:hypothetical protein
VNQKKKRADGEGTSRRREEAERGRRNVKV